MPLNGNGFYPIEEITAPPNLCYPKERKPYRISNQRENSYILASQIPVNTTSHHTQRTVANHQKNSVWDQGDALNYLHYNFSNVFKF